MKAYIDGFWKVFCVRLCFFNRSKFFFLFTSFLLLTKFCLAITERCTQPGVFWWSEEEEKLTFFDEKNCIFGFIKIWWHNFGLDIFFSTVWTIKKNYRIYMEVHQQLSLSWYFLRWVISRISCSLTRCLLQYIYICNTWNKWNCWENVGHDLRVLSLLCTAG